MNAVTQGELLRALPYARRYARALAGGQEAGDRLVAEALRALWLRAEDLLFLGSWPAATPAGKPPRDLAAADDWVARARRGQ